MDHEQIWKKQINNITPPSAFRGCFGLELNYLHLRVITEFLQERGDSQKGLLHAAGGAWSRRAWCQTGLCVLSCSVISLNKRTVSAWVVLWTLASLPQTELGPRHSYLHLASKVGVFFVSRTATKVTLFYIYPAAAAERGENGFKGRELQRRGEKTITGAFACQSCQTFLLHSDIYKVEEGLRAPAFADSPNENRQSN